MGPRTRGARAFALSVAAGLVGLIGPSSAGAAQTFGSNLSNTPNGGLAGDPQTVAQSLLPTGSLAPGGLTSPIDGVVVRWRIKVGAAAAFPPAVALRLTRPGDSDTRTGAGTSETGTPAVSAISEFPTRLAVQAGDSLGVDYPGFVQLDATAVPPGARSLIWLPQLQDGGPPRAALGPLNHELLVNADVEPDADCDGFGDETQDPSVEPPGACPANTPQPDPVDSVAPDTTITGGPKDKTKKKTATFEFTANEPGATFQCSLDGGPFAPCASPDTLKVKKGKHTFSVRARDAAGNVDGSPPIDTWKVKKKKKK